MERNTLLFWFVTLGLLGASVFYGINAARESKRVLKADGEVASGDVVQILQIVDGDTVVARKEGSAPVTIRLLGIKALDGKAEKDEAAAFANASIAELRRVTQDQPVRVLLHTTPKDRTGRTLATLYNGETDVAVHLLRRGLVLAYPVYPFPTLQTYLAEQELARKERVGLWSDPNVATRAGALSLEWRRASQ